MSNGKHAYRVTIHISEHTKTTNVLGTHRQAIEWAELQRDCHCGRKYRYSPINALGMTRIGDIGIEIIRERTRA